MPSYRTQAQIRAEMIAQLEALDLDRDELAAEIAEYDAECAEIEAFCASLAAE